MDVVLLVVATFLLVNVLAGLVRLLRGPAPADRMIAALLFGTTGVGLLAVLAEVAEVPALRDVALVLGLLACVLAAAFTSRPRRSAPDRSP
ncbi:monovalent cation/H+ antiporter complex subunit F [Trujillonella humicola]|uniref:monovalent cation/H+ antiporter complex subunit F n=1 Tax=Trujillonella humicola TaxID=3383699 RepID=UPI003905D1C7